MTLPTSPAATSEATTTKAPEIVHQSLSATGQPLDAATRAFFEPRFGHDFSQIRIHADHKAAQANRSIYARAFAFNGHIAFADGQYAPTSPTGRKLLAHELAHVVQQSESPHTVRRDLINDAKKALEKKAEEIATQQLGKLANAPAGLPSGFTGDPKCGAKFCQPFASKAAAVADLIWAGPLILAGIAKKMNSRVVPLWAKYLSGGSPTKNLSSEFGKDFTASPTTATTTKILVGELRKDVEANQTALTGAVTPVTIDFTPRMSTALAAIDDPTGLDQMNFNFPADIAASRLPGSRATCR